MTIQLPASIELSKQSLINSWVFAHLAYALVSHIMLMFKVREKIRVGHGYRFDSISACVSLIAKLFVGFEYRVVELVLKAILMVVHPAINNVLFMGNLRKYKISTETTFMCSGVDDCVN